MPNPVFVGHHPSTLNTTTTPKTVTFTPAAGNLVAVVMGDAGNSSTITLTGGLTWTLAQQIAGASTNAAASAWTGTGAGGSITPSLADSSGAEFGFDAVEFSGAVVGVSAKTAAGVSGAPTLNITTQADNSAILCVCADWSATAGARTYRTVNGITPTVANSLVLDENQDAAYCLYIWYYNDAGTAGSKTVGMSAPSQTYSMVAVEIKGAVPGDDGPQIVPMMLPALSYGYDDEASSMATVFPMRPWQRRFQWVTQPWLNTDDVATGPFNYNQSLSGSLSFTGSLTKFTSTTRTAALSFVGALTKSTSYHLVVAALSFIGSLVRSVGKLLTAALSFVGSQTRKVSKTMTAALSFVGTLPRAVSYHLTAALSFVGSLTKLTSTSRTAALSFVGSLSATIVLKKTLTASLSFSGSLTTAVVHFFTKALSGALSFTGAQTRQTGKALSGALSFTGSQSRRVGHLMTGALSFTGNQTRRIAKGMVSALSFAGIFSGFNPNQQGTPPYTVAGSSSSAASVAGAASAATTVTGTSAPSVTVR